MEQCANALGLQIDIVLILTRKCLYMKNMARTLLRAILFANAYELQVRLPHQGLSGQQMAHMERYEGLNDSLTFLSLWMACTHQILLIV
eukprot:scaffold484939_cov19-Prasinocladus_malaysianus.AAC.1